MHVFALPTLVIQVPQMPLVAGGNFFLCPVQNIAQNKHLFTSNLASNLEALRTLRERERERGMEREREVTTTRKLINFL